MSLYKKIVNLDRGMSVYGTLEKDEEDIEIPFAMSFYFTATKISELLPDYVADLKRGVCHEVLGLDFDMVTNLAYWLKNGKLKSDMEALSDMTLKQRGIEFAYKGFKPKTTWEFYMAIEQKVAGMVEILKEVQRLIQAAPPSLYANFFLYQKSLVDKRPIEAAHARWRMDVGVQTPDLLKDRQALVVADFLKLKVLRFTQGPSKREIEKVNLDEVRSHLPYGYELPEDFEKCCARFRRFISWDGDILKIDYDKFGKYLFVYYYNLTPAERQAFIELDLMLDLINEDIKSLKEMVLPEPLATPEGRNLLEKAQEAGWIDERYQPKLSNTKTAVLAFEIAKRLNIKDHWKVFEALWHRKNMYKDYYKALQQKQSLAFRDQLKQTL